MKALNLIVLFLCCAYSYSQTSVNGTILDDNGLPVPGANIIVIGTTTGTISDFDGKFSLSVNQEPPFSLQISSIGFETVTEEITTNPQTISVTLIEGTFLEEIVISASRTPERVFESPVTIERFGIKQIKNTASSDFYDGLENLKGVDINTNSLTFKSINTRGFADFANTRFMQLVDGMDNSAPALNFPLGNLLGMIETDVQSVELLPGAASALYGANAFNGILFMQSKSPFKFPGISGYFKQGITSQEAAGDNAYTDFGIRMAHKFSDKFAGKVNFSYLKGTDWQANNTEDKLFRGFTREDPNYDGTNVYGDEVATNIRVASGGLGIVPDIEVSRTGYNESDLTNYNAESIKADWGLYFRPWANDVEFAYVGKVGSGSTIYQGSNRYAINDFFLQQHKLEVRNDNFFVRGYITEDKAGDSYDMVFTGININRMWKGDTEWFGDYINTYIGSTLGGATDAQAHSAARAVADTGRYEPGSAAFQSALNTVTTNPDLAKGSKFQDNSRIYHSDVNYNFGHLLEVVEIQVGGSWRQYELNSFGTIYTDSDGPINYSEVGVYTQAQKTFELTEALELKLTGSVRYDKSELFDGFFSPRLAAGFTINDDHNLRASIQTGFRNPTTQDLYIGLDAGRAVLIGGAQDNPSRYTNTYTLNSDGSTINFSGESAYTNSYTASSVTRFAESGNPDDLVVANSSLSKPEQVTSLEAGYRGKIERFIIDLSGYYNMYTDFLSNETVIAPFYGTVGDNSQSLLALANSDYQVYRTYTNTSADVNSYGAAIGVTTKILGNYDFGINYTYAKLDFDQTEDPDFQTSFNTPEHKVKASFGNTEVYKNLGFNVAWRWSDSFYWESTFGDGNVPAYHVVDAQINYRIPKIKSSLKLGATNLLGEEYFTAFGTGLIGSQYYLSLTINNL